MRFRTGLSLFQRTSQRGCWNIASFHSPHSLTWRWILSFSLFRADEARVRPLWWRYITNGGPHWGIRIPFLGLLTWQQQIPMWYRDLYQRLRDERDFPQRDQNYTPPQLPPISATSTLH